MNHKVLSKDMAGLVQAMKLAQQYSHTTVESMSFPLNMFLVNKLIDSNVWPLGEYRKAMLESAHVLVVNSKNLLDTIDQVRLRISTSPESPNRSLLTNQMKDENEMEKSLSVEIT